MRLFLSPRYPHEETLRRYHVATGLTVCSYLERYSFFNRTKANAAFVASVFGDYLNATGAPGWYCGGDFLRTDMEYILGANPMNTSYVVGYGAKFPRQVYHRGASIPPNTNDSCREGFRWLYAETPNPNNITGAMVGGPDRFDKFEDVRSNFNYTEPSLAANAGLVAALVSLTSSSGFGVEKNAIFSYITPLYRNSPTPSPPWKP
ncbi:PREDICTED: endoglucanase 7-like [Erythranthe guttata]|uniref:endoglucanase 7-like n=1 Tax=Erythranthe guttata TaxID=4155 RepID=UPI00064D94D0|nr:PREDICTED: endoglucanase 7-like [Erythranthe guttata]|eukprot:XP_012854150.1 PREDICTED: endoglucanase 7-like [Erythranthe guttata]